MHFADRFRLGRWNKRVLEGKLLVSGRASAPPPHLVKHGKEKEIWRWFVTHGNPREVLGKLEHDLRVSMSKQGTVVEQDCLRLVLEDFDVILPSKISKRKLLRYANLLIGIIDLWDWGRTAKGVEDRKNVERANPKKDLRYEALFQCADWIYSVGNKNARDLQTWLLKNRRADIVVKGKKVRVKKGVSDKSLECMVEQAQSISGREALREANRQHKIFSAEDFDDLKRNLQDAYSKYKRPGHRRKKGHGVSRT